ncbi:MAG: hypothetical protein U1E17_12680 [Geminicoccaceae bacterium]
MSGHLTADREQLGQFVNALFTHADEGGFISLRGFGARAQQPPVEIGAVQLAARAWHRWSPRPQARTRAARHARASGVRAADLRRLQKFDTAGSGGGRPQRRRAEFWARRAAGAERGSGWRACSGPPRWSWPQAARPS